MRVSLPFFPLMRGRKNGKEKWNTRPLWMRKRPCFVFRRNKVFLFFISFYPIKKIAFGRIKGKWENNVCPRIFSLSSPGQFLLSSHSSLSFSFFSISFSFCFPLFRKGIGKELEIFFFLFSSKKGKRGGKRRRNVKKNWKRRGF